MRARERQLLLQRQNETKMKKMMLILMITLMSVIGSTPAGAKTGNNDVKKAIPTNIVVKQTTHFNDGRVLTIYYKKSGTQCEVYSPCDTDDYVMADASKIKSTNFEVVDNVEGKLYRKASFAEVARIIKKLVNQYL